MKLNYIMMKRKYFLAIAVLGLLLLNGVSIPVSGQDFNTSSAMMNTGSTNASTITPVGAESVNELYSTAAPRTANARRATMEDDDFGTLPDGGVNDISSPVGNPLTMLFFALATAGVVALHRYRVK